MSEILTYRTTETILSYSVIINNNKKRTANHIISDSWPNVYNYISFFAAFSKAEKQTIQNINKKVNNKIHDRQQFVDTIIIIITKEKKMQNTYIALVIKINTYAY